MTPPAALSTLRTYAQPLATEGATTGSRPEAPPSAAIARSCRSSRAARVDDTLRRAAREKAAALNQHVLGYGAVAEAEWAAAGIAAPDLPAMRKYRLERIRAELKRRDYAGALLYDPVNIRYATNSTNMQLWVAHNPTRHCFVATDGPVVLFDYFSCEHLSDHSGMVDEVRPAVSWIYLYGGELTDRRVRALGGRASPISCGNMAAATAASPSTISTRKAWPNSPGSASPSAMARR